jgi:hypothetical protein
MFISQSSQSNLFNTEAKPRSKNTIYITNAQTITSMDKLTSSLSPNKRTPTHQLKKHVSSKNGSKGRKEDKNSTSNMLSIQLLKPPIKNNMQSLFQPNQSKSGMNDCPTPTMTTLNNVRDFSAKDSSIDRSLNSNNRCST